MNSGDMKLLCRMIELSEYISDSRSACCVDVLNYREETIIHVTYATYFDYFGKIDQQISWMTHSHTISEILQYLEQIHASEPRQEQAA